MLKRFRRTDPDLIDQQIKAVADEMTIYGPDEPHYEGLLSFFERLHEIKAKNRRTPVSSDKKLEVLGSLAVTLIVVAYEQKHIWGTKALDVAFRRKS